MPDEAQEKLKLVVRVPDDLGLTPDQVTALKHRVTVEFIGLTVGVATPTQIVIQLVDGHGGLQGGL
jgi:hypothetical protein